MVSRKGISPRNSPAPQVTEIDKKKESADFTIGKIFIVVAVVIIVFAVGAQYTYINYYYLLDQISTKSKLPTTGIKLDPVRFSLKFQKI